MTDIEKTFLSLVRLGIGTTSTYLEELESVIAGNDRQSVNWPAIQALADKQGLSAVIVDGLEKIPQGELPPKEVLLQWVGTVLQGYEYRYELYRRTIAEMAAFYNSHGYKMMVLKGYACSLDWPKPEHRPAGDIDIWQFERQKDADSLLTTAKGIKVDTSHHHHTVFHWRDYMVENHYDFVNVHHHKSNVRLESIFKNLGQDDTHFVEVCGEKVYLPSPNLHALFLLKHSMTHFAAGEMTLRQLLDWAFFAKNHSKEIDWLWLQSVLDQFGMNPAYTLFNAICVEDLGFESSIFPVFQFNPDLKERVLSEILSPEFDEPTPAGLLRRIPYKFRRWRANGWKHQLCYNESMASAFWSGLWSHLIKPSSI
jgi:hypothetical protein